MSTAVEFDLAATRFDNAGQLLRDLAVRVRRLLDSGVLVGGVVTRSVAVLVESDSATAHHAAEVTEALADECHRRAEICREHEGALRAFDSDLSRWRSRHDAWHRQRSAYQAGETTSAPGVEPRRPTRPVAPWPWVEARADAASGVLR